MQRTVFLAALAATLLIAPAPVFAGKGEGRTLTFYEDPVYKSVGAGDEHPMSELTGMAERGDTRAQFILGDLHAKGKGGLVKNEEKGAKWFEESAKAGYGPSYIRLAALAKHRKDYIAAWSWYDLGSDYAQGRDARYSAQARDKLEREQKLSGDDIAAAHKLSDAFRKERDAAREKKAEADRVKRQQEDERKKAEGAKAEGKPAPKKDKDNAADKTPATYTTTRQETRYND